MGLEIYPKAKVPRGGLLRRPMSRNKLFACISSAVRRFVTNDILAKALTVYTEQHTLYVNTHPAAPSIEFTWNPAGEVEATVKTSTAGPGFHAFAVDLVQHVGTECGLDWNWTDADETEYAITGDFEPVKKQMLNILRAIAGAFVERMEDSYTGIMANMPIGFPRPKEKYYCITPLGPFSQEWWKNTYKEKNDDELVLKGKEFYAWWDEGFTGDFYRNLGLVLMWSDISWHIASNDHEAGTNKLAVESLEKSREVAPDIVIPEQELDELKRLISLDPEDVSPVPKSEGIGYRRYPCRFEVPGNWTIVVPGYFWQDLESDGTEMVFWYTGRTIRLTTFTFEYKNGVSKSPGEALADSFVDNEATGERVTFESERVSGRAIISKVLENGYSYWFLSGKVAAQNSLCVVSVCFDKDEDKIWAIDTFKTVDHASLES